MIILKSNKDRLSSMEVDEKTQELIIKESTEKRISRDDYKTLGHHKRYLERMIIDKASASLQLKDEVLQLKDQIQMIENLQKERGE